MRCVGCSHPSSIDTSMSQFTTQLNVQGSGLGRVTRLIVDPRGSRLVCCHENSNVLSVFSIQHNRFASLYELVWALMYRGFLNNPISDNLPQEVVFVPWKEKGSMLCILWKSGHILFYHLCYSFVC